MLASESAVTTVRDGRGEEDLRNSSELISKIVNFCFPLSVSRSKLLLNCFDFGQLRSELLRPDDKRTISSRIGFSESDGFTLA